MEMKNSSKYLLIALFLIFFLSGNISLKCQIPSPSQEFKSLTEKVEYFRTKYKVNCANEKITDNFGNGFEALYGTRNMRTILYGIAYRGGANNFYNKEEKRDNHNPLPEDGLRNLADEGFSEAVYLYSTNFASSKKQFDGANKNSLNYIQNSGNSSRDLRKIFQDILERIQNPNKGPIYLHCWNGWHQSGYVASAILMQFCNITNEQAYQYWLDNTDGVNKGYDNVKNQVKSFVPFKDIQISDSVRNEICPCLKKK